MLFGYSPWYDGKHSQLVLATVLQLIKVYVLARMTIILLKNSRNSYRIEFLLPLLVKKFTPKVWKQYALFCKHTRKVGLSSLCLRFSHFELKIMLKVCLISKRYSS